MACPGQRLWICATQLHQVCIEVHPHSREGGWHLNAVLREYLHAFHHYQLYDGLASIGSRHHDGLRCLTFAVCHVHGADSTRHQGHYQWWRNQKWRCLTTIEGVHGWCNHTRPVRSGHIGATGPLPRPLHMGTDDLPGKLKAWCFRHGLLSRLLWPLQIYEISLSRVETIQQHINKYLCKWLGVPPCFSTVGLYTATGMLQLPSRPSQKSSRLEKLGSTWCFGTHRTTSYAKYSLK